MKLISFMLAALIGTTAYAFEPAEIRALVAKPHTEELALDELKLLTIGREFEIFARSGNPGEKLTGHSPVKSKDKVVDGKYLVSEFQPPGVPGSIYMVITFDRAASAYRMWTLFPDNKLWEGIGTALPDSRVISWVYLATPYGENSQSLSTVEYTDAGAKWREIIFVKSKIISVNEGSANKLR